MIWRWKLTKQKNNACLTGSSYWTFVIYVSLSYSFNIKNFKTFSSTFMQLSTVALSQNMSYIFVFFNLSSLNTILNNGNHAYDTLKFIRHWSSVLCLQRQQHLGDSSFSSRLRHPMAPKSFLTMIGPYFRLPHV